MAMLIFKTIKIHMIHLNALDYISPVSLSLAL